MMRNQPPEGGVAGMFPSLRSFSGWHCEPVNGCRRITWIGGVEMSRAFSAVDLFLGALIPGLR